MIRVGVLGARGYTGLGLLRLLCAHPEVEIGTATSREGAGTPVQLDSRSGGTPQALSGLHYLDPAEADWSGLDAVFTAAPAGVAASYAETLLNAGVRVFDLSADFRLRDSALWEKWYGMRHPAKELLPEAAYGLPELWPKDLRQARIVACPGCYATTMQLPLVPLLRAGVVDAGSLIADAMSGVSGAGRSADLQYLYGEVSENFRAYQTQGHRHHPEIVQQLQTVTENACELIFLPHLVPMFAGIFATIHARAPQGFEAVAEVLHKEYANSTFVDVIEDELCTASVLNSNSCLIRAIPSPQAGKDKVTIFSVLDNLIKGAAGQAIQCFNLAFGLPEDTGLTRWR